MTNFPEQPNFQKHPERPYGPVEANLALVGLQAAHGARLEACGIVDMLIAKLGMEPAAQGIVFGEASRFLPYREIPLLAPKERRLGVMLDTDMKTESGVVIHQRVMFQAISDGPDKREYHAPFSEDQAREVGSMVAQLEDWVRQDRLPGIDPLLTHIPLIIGELGTPGV